MFRNLLKSRTPASAPKIAAGERVYAIGDVHGCLDLLERLLADVASDNASRGPAETSLIFLGDLIDRGPDSAGVVERVRSLAAESGRVRVLRGNHEEVFLAALDGDGSAMRLFTRIGGRETALSYGVAADAYEAMDHDELAAALVGAVPPEHRAFLAGGSDMEVVGDYAFVHAGVDPARPFGDQSVADLRWIRNRFLDHRTRLERMVVHGHTISDGVERKPHRIGIDTGAYLTGQLTALGLEGESCWTLDTGRS